MRFLACVLFSCHVRTDLHTKIAAQSILERERERQVAEANRSREERQQAAEQEAARQAEDKRRYHHLPRRAIGSGQLLRVYVHM